MNEVQSSNTPSNESNLKIRSMVPYINKPYHPSVCKIEHNDSPPSVSIITGNMRHFTVIFTLATPNTRSPNVYRANIYVEKKTKKEESFIQKVTRRKERLDSPPQRRMDILRRPIQHIRRKRPVTAAARAVRSRRREGAADARRSNGGRRNSSRPGRRVAHIGGGGDAVRGGTVGGLV